MSRSSGRRPADRYKPGAAPREVVWAEVRRRSAAGDAIIARGIADAARLNPRTVCDYLLSLARSGHLRPVGDGVTVTLDRVYVLERDTGVEAPRVRRDGSLVEQGSGTEAMWRTMQVLGEFTADDLAHHATTDRCSVSPVTAASYVQTLARAGYLRIVSPASNAGGRAVYRLIRRSGPRPPQVQRVKRVYDPNTGEVHGDAALEREPAW